MRRLIGYLAVAMMTIVMLGILAFVVWYSFTDVNLWEVKLR